MSLAKGKIVLIDEEKCNGCGECVPSCEEGAIVIENGKAKLKESLCDGLGACLGTCPVDAIKIIGEEESSSPAEEKGSETSSTIPLQIENWPIQLKLLPVEVPFFKNANILIAADCAAFAYGNFHRDILKGHTLVIGCPKLDDSEGYIEKLTSIFEKNDIKTITVVHMEVPCCFGLVHVVKTALSRSKQNIPFKTINISVKGKKL